MTFSALVTTYLTNKYDLPFAPFVGVNHHGQSILLGFGLVSTEDIESFTWLFKSWLACMNNRAPAAIVTDQDMAMKNAIEFVFPDARHRWCLWHIMKNIPQKLQGYSEYKSIKKTLKEVVYNSVTCEEFDEQWICFMIKFKLQDNKWLSSLYKERRRWVPSFLKNTFFAGMSSTQRSESMSAFFNGYVNAKTTLKQFVEQYENALRSKTQKEIEEDFNSFDHWLPCITTYSFERQLQEAYTTSKFKEFQEEVKGKIYCSISSTKNECGYHLYEVSEDISFKNKIRRVVFQVYFREGDCDIKCNCQLFEFKGIICRHVVTVLTQNQVDKILDKYIIRRWRKDVKRNHTKVKILYSDWVRYPENERFDRMCNGFYEVAELASGHEERTMKVMSVIQDLISELKIEDVIVNNNLPICSEEEDNRPAHVSNKKGREVIIHSPVVARKRGQPPSKRLQSKTEQVIKKKIQKKNKENTTWTVKERNEGRRKKRGEIAKDINFEQGPSKNDSQGYMVDGIKYYKAKDSLATHSFDLNLQVPSVEDYHTTECAAPVILDLNLQFPNIVNSDFHNIK